MQLDEGAEFRTGPRSSVTFEIPPDQIITLDRLGTIKILEAIQTGRKLTTNLGMKYGRTRYDIQAAGLQHDASVRSPGSALAIRGTDVVFQDEAPFIPLCTSVHGRVQFRNMQREFVALGSEKPTRMRADRRGPGQQALAETHLDPKGSFAGRTDDEGNVVQDQPTLAFQAQFQASISNLVKGFGRLPGNVVGVPEVPGPLSFDLIWQRSGKSTGNINLDLTVTDPLGQVVSAKNPLVGQMPVQGVHQGDNPGRGGAGAERVEWGAFFFEGMYKIQAKNVRGAPAQTFIEVSRDFDKILAQYGIDPNKPLILRQGQTFTATVQVKKNSGSTPSAAAAVAPKSQAPAGRSRPNRK
jgi:hypothetical protein